MKTFKAIKNFFRSKYYVLYELITLRLMLRVNNMVRKLIISKGKDPDYVAPPPPQPPPPPAHVVIDQETAQRRIERAQKFFGGSWMGREDWIKQPGKHPVLQSRANYEAKKSAPDEQVADEALQVAVSTAPVSELDKVVRAREVCQEMINKGLLQDTPQSIEDQAIEIAKWTDEAFAAFSRVLARHSVKE